MQILNERNKSLNFIMYAILLPLVLAVLTIVFFAFDQSVLTNETRPVIANVISISAVGAAAFYLVFKYRFDRIDTQTIIILLVVVGFFMRLGYVVEYAFYQHQHDVESLASNGHLSYIYNLVVGNGLPKSNDWQFSHPPLQHLLAAVVVKLSNLFGFSFDRSFENVQLMTLLFSAIALMVSVSIFKELKFDGKGLLAATAVVSLHPTFFIFAGSINNDCLATLLSLCAVLFLIKWWGSPTFKNAALIGLFAGLGMMTKFSVTILVPCIAIVVLVKLFKSKCYSFVKFLLQTVAFLGISMPLGLWYQIRNLILFNQPIGHVAQLSVDNPLYTGDVSFVERFLLPFSTKEVGVYVNPWEEYNVFFFALRSSLFGEYSIGNIAFAVFLIVFTVLLVALTIVGTVKILKQGKGVFDSADWIMPLLLVVQIGFFAYFNIRYPFGCTMDYRYIPITAVISAFVLGKLINNKDVKESAVSRVLYDLTSVSVAGFCAFSVLTYI